MNTASHKLSGTSAGSSSAAVYRSLPLGESPAAVAPCTSPSSSPAVASILSSRADAGPVVRAQVNVAEIEKQAFRAKLDRILRG